MAESWYPVLGESPVAVYLWTPFVTNPWSSPLMEMPIFAKSASVGSVHVQVMDVMLAVSNRRPETDAGGVVSTGGVVPPRRARL